jgi:hypothetical protein
MSLILIVEDNDKNLKLVATCCKKGYATIRRWAEDGLVLARGQADLV